MNRRLAAAATLALVLAGCRAEGAVVIPEGNLPADIYASPRPLPTASAIPNGRVYMVRDGRLVQVERTLPPAASLPQALLAALLEGPGNVRAVSAIPPDTRIIDVAVVAGLATVDLSQEFEEGGAQSSLALRVAQIVYTLTEDPEVDQVLIAIDGTVRPVLAGNLRDVLERPVRREDYGALAPGA